MPWTKRGERGGWGIALAAGVAVLGLSGCSNLGYYWQSLSGHLHMLNATRTVDDWLGDAQTPARLKAGSLSASAYAALP